MFFQQQHIDYDTIKLHNNKQWQGWRWQDFRAAKFPPQIPWCIAVLTRQPAYHCCKHNLLSLFSAASPSTWPAHFSSIHQEPCQVSCSIVWSFLVLQSDVLWGGGQQQQVSMWFLATLAQLSIQSSCVSCLSVALGTAQSLDVGSSFLQVRSLPAGARQLVLAVASQLQPHCAALGGTGLTNKGTTNAHWYQLGILRSVLTCPWRSAPNTTHHPEDETISVAKQTMLDLAPLLTVSPRAACGGMWSSVTTPRSPYVCWRPNSAAFFYKEALTLKCTWTLWTTHLISFRTNGPTEKASTRQRRPSS